jgi:CBS domain-containing protein
MLVKDLMTRRPALIAADDSIAQAAEQMCLRCVGMLPVIDNYENRRLIGIITDRDIVTRHLAKGHGPFALVRDFMSREPLVTVQPDTPLLEAAEKMAAHHVRRLPVTTDDGVVTAVLTQADMADIVTPKNPLLIERAIETMARPGASARS